MVDARSAWAVAITVACTLYFTAAPAVPSQSTAAIPIELSRQRPGFDLRVLTYNIEGLPMPARIGRAEAVVRIADRVAALAGTAQSPDVILIQEGFVEETAKIGVEGGYAFSVDGPARALDGPVQPFRGDDPLVEGEHWWKGEGIGKALGGGLWIFSRYPIVKAVFRPFGANACAGYDCLANKGAVFVRLAIPGAPQPLDIFTSHLNSSRSAHVDVSRSAEAHHRQAAELASFAQAFSDGAAPMIFGGDFNIKNKQGRFVYAARQLSDFNIVNVVCAVRSDTCDDRSGFNGASPWMGTEDIQGYRDGASIQVQPVRAEMLFDAPRPQDQLSDHAGYLVTYRLSWGPSALIAR